MRFTFIYIFGLLWLINSNSYAQIYLSEDFESGRKPIGWTEEYGNPSANIEYRNGGFKENYETEDSREPRNAFAGNSNLMIFRAAPGSYTARLVSPVLNMSGAQKPELRFWRASVDYGNIDELNVYARSNPGQGIKTQPDQGWVLLKSYSESTDTELEVILNDFWKEESFFIPDSLLSNTFQLAFEGVAHYGRGMCLDNITLSETGIIPKYLNNIEYNQETSEVIPTESENNPVLRIKLNVNGNTGSLILDELSIQSLMNNSFIKPNGLKLYATESSFFSSGRLLKTLSASSKTVRFNNLDYLIPNGFSYLWLTADIDSNALHDADIDFAIAKDGVIMHLDTDGIEFNDSIYLSGDQVLYIDDNGLNSVPLNYTFPDSIVSPEGSQNIQQSIYYDNFRTQKWELTGDFEIDVPQALGEWVESKADPAFAFSGMNVLGNDLITDGLYESNMDSAYAKSPIFDATFYKEIKVSFYRWLNNESADQANVYFSSDSGASWTKLDDYANFSDDHWIQTVFDLSEKGADRTPGIQFMLNLNTDATTEKSGWNIDNFAITGNYISNDVGVSGWISPLSGCGHGKNEVVQVRVKNYGPNNSEGAIPIGYSFDGGATYTVDTLFQILEPQEETIFTFRNTFDLTQEGYYNNIIAKTFLASDEYAANDSIDTALIILPTYNLPVTQNFETTEGFWVPIKNDLWEYGIPNNAEIDEAPSGEKAWVTNLNGFYSDGDSAILESPCFNLSGTTYPLIDFKLNSNSLDSLDGAQLQYSLNLGNSWNLLDENTQSYPWDWYNMSNVQALAGKGFSGDTDGWIHMRQFLPNDATGQPSIQFRWVFEATNSGSFYEGIGFDDFRISEAPLDIGITNLMAPGSACELSENQHITVELTNFSINSVPTGTKIPVDLYLDSTLIINDTLVLESNLARDQKIEFTFSDSLDMFKAKSYNIKAISKLQGDNNFFGAYNNDTLNKWIEVYGIPEYDLGPTIGMEVIDTLLDAGAGFVSYNWNNGAASTQTFQVNDPGLYHIEVINDRGCVKTDSVEVLVSNNDLGVIELISPLSSCDFEVDTSIVIKIKNFRDRIYEPGEIIKVAYKIADRALIEEDIMLTDSLKDYDTLEYTFNALADFSSYGDYDIKIYTITVGDIEYGNDTLITSISSWKYPNITNGNKTFETNRGDTLVFSIDSTFKSYIWTKNDQLLLYDSNNFRPSNNTSGLYVVKVQDVDGCGYDSTYFEVIASDFVGVSITQIEDACEHSENELIGMTIINASPDTLLPGFELPVTVTVNNGITLPDTLILDQGWYPKDTLEFVMDTGINLNGFGSYNIEVSLDYVSDIVSTNNLIQKTIQTFIYPVLTLDQDTVYSSEPNSLVLEAPNGYEGYRWNFGDVSINNNYNVISLESRWHYAEVSNEYNCFTLDSIYVFSTDIRVSDIIAPANACVLTKAETLSVNIQNMGNDTLQPGYRIPLAFKLDGQIKNISEQVLQSVLLPNEKVEFSFSNDLDLSEDRAYKFEIYTMLANDVVISNDTLKQTLQTFGEPKIDLGNDTAILANSFTLDAGEQEFYEYQWQNGANTSSFVATESGIYSVIVSDSRVENCTSTDQITLTFIQNNIELSSVNVPLLICQHGRTAANITITNAGNQSISSNSQAIYFGYRYQNVEFKTTLNVNLKVNESDLYFIDNLSFAHVGLENVTFFLEMEGDIQEDNNTLDIDVSTRENATPILGGENDTLIEDLPLTLSPDAGHESYLWNNGSEESSIQVSESGLYWVDITHASGCLLRDYVYVEDLIGIHQLFSKAKSIKVYPNPVQERLHIEYPSNLIGTYTLRIFDITGHLVTLNQQIRSSYEDNVLLNVSHLKSGIYMVEIRTEDEIYSTKFLKL